MLKGRKGQFWLGEALELDLAHNWCSKHKAGTSMIFVAFPELNNFCPTLFPQFQGGGFNLMTCSHSLYFVRFRLKFLFSSCFSCFHLYNGKGLFPSMSFQGTLFFPCLLTLSILMNSVQRSCILMLYPKLL